MFSEHQFVGTGLAEISPLIEAWKKRWPNMSVLALLAEAEKAAVATLQEACNACSVPLYGAIFPALLDAGGFRNQGLLLICMREPVGVFLLDDIQHNGAALLHNEISKVMRDYPPADGSAGTLLTIFDAMIPNIGSMLGQLHGELAQAPHYIGVNAGSETFAPMPCVFDHARTVSNGVLGIYLPHAVNSVVEHAYEESISQWQATSAEGNRIVEINGHAAFDVYQEIVWEQYAVRLTKENFYEYAVHFPFGLVTAIDVLVRIPVGLGEDGSIVCVGEISSNSMLRLLRAPSLDSSLCTQNIAKILVDQSKAGALNSLLTFYCAGRRMHFGAESVSELAGIHQAMHQVPMFGALSLGEIDTVEDLGFPRFHNAAIVCLAV